MNKLPESNMSKRSREFRRVRRLEILTEQLTCDFRSLPRDDQRVHVVNALEEFRHRPTRFTDKEMTAARELVFSLLVTLEQLGGYRGSLYMASLTALSMIDDSLSWELATRGLPWNAVVCARRRP